MTFDKEMKTLEQAAKDGKPTAPISNSIPGGLSVDDAHEICEGNLQRRLEVGEKLIGYKIGFTNIAMCGDSIEDQQ